MSARNRRGGGGLERVALQLTWPMSEACVQEYEPRRPVSSSHVPFIATVEIEKRKAASASRVAIEFGSLAKSACAALSLMWLPSVNTDLSGRLSSKRYSKRSTNARTLLPPSVSSAWSPMKYLAEMMLFGGLVKAFHIGSSFSVGIGSPQMGRPACPILPFISRRNWPPL